MAEVVGSSAREVGRGPLRLLCGGPRGGADPFRRCLAGPRFVFTSRGEGFITSLCRGRRARPGRAQEARLRPLKLMLLARDGTVGTRRASLNAVRAICDSLREDVADFAESTGYAGVLLGALDDAETAADARAVVVLVEQHTGICALRYNFNFCIYIYNLFERGPKRNVRNANPAPPRACRPRRTGAGDRRQPHEPCSAPRSTPRTPSPFPSRGGALSAGSCRRPRRQRCVHDLRRRLEHPRVGLGFDSDSSSMNISNSSP